MKTNKLKFYRMRRGWSQSEVSRRCGVCYWNICRYESGVCAPSLKIKKRLARCLGAKLEEVFPGGMKILSETRNGETKVRIRKP